MLTRERELVYNPNLYLEEGSAALRGITIFPPHKGCGRTVCKRTILEERRELFFALNAEQHG